MANPTFCRFSGCLSVMSVRCSPSHSLVSSPSQVSASGYLCLKRFCKDDLSFPNCWFQECRQVKSYYNERFCSAEATPGAPEFSVNKASLIWPHCALIIPHQKICCSSIHTEWLVRVRTESPGVFYQKFCETSSTPAHCKRDRLGSSFKKLLLRHGFVHRYNALWFYAPTINPLVISLPFSECFRLSN